MVDAEAAERLAYKALLGNESLLYVSKILNLDEESERYEIGHKYGFC